MPVVSNDGVRIAYDVSGKGRPIVLLHGWGCERTWWIHAGFVDDLQRDYRVINVDVRAHGESDKPHDPAAYSDEALIGDVLAVADAEGIDRFAVWGQSMGGSLAWRMAIATPQRVAALVTTGAWEPPMASSGFDPDDPGDAALQRGGMRALIELYKEEDGEAYPREYPQWAEDATLRADAEALLAFDSRIRPAMPAPELLAVPTLLINGRIRRSRR